MMRILILSLLLVHGFVGTTHAQQAPVPKDKAVVYFVRPDPGALLIQYQLYDGEMHIGNLGVRKYIRYECDPGEHVFWGKSENRSFATGNLEAGKSYVIETMTLPGGLSAQVKLLPIDPRDRKGIPKRVRNLMNKKEPKFVIDSASLINDEKTAGVGERGMERYNKLDAKGSRKVAKITAKMAVKPQDFTAKKNKKRPR